MRARGVEGEGERQEACKGPNKTFYTRSIAGTAGGGGVYAIARVGCCSTPMARLWGQERLHASGESTVMTMSSVYEY